MGSASGDNAPPTPAPAAQARLPSKRPGHRKSLSTPPAMVTSAPSTPSRRKRDLTSSRLGTKDESVASGPPDLRSLRSSGRRRVRALRAVERSLTAACAGEGLEEFVAFQAHTPLLSLLGRHSASLAKRASSSSLQPGDDLARHLAPEIDIAFNILQGLTLISRACKAAVGERWAMEMFLDLLLLLRTQPAAVDSPKPTVLYVLDLLFCVLVDAPEHSRMFEDLAGLEAVTRVLRGTGVAKDVRMKCCEFLYFYLLPEGATAMPDMAAGLPPGLSIAHSRSPSLASEAGSSFATNDTTAPSSPRSRLMSEAPKDSPSRWESDMPFVPQTPRKKPQPKLGFQTPSSRDVRRVSGNSTATTLTPVPSSPVGDDGSLTNRDSAAWAAAQRAVNRRLGDGSMSDTGSRTSSGSSSSSSITVVPKQRGSRSPTRASSVAPTPSRSTAPSPAPGLSRSSSQQSLTGLGASLARRPSKRAPSPLTTTPETPSQGPSRTRHTRSQSALGTAPTAAPTPQRGRGFPADLTRGALPSVSTPLTPSRRVSGTDGVCAREAKNGAKDKRPGAKGTVRSVAEKKEMLGMWLGNVDQLVAGVEKVGFFDQKPHRGA